MKRYGKGKLTAALLCYGKRCEDVPEKLSSSARSCNAEYLQSEHELPFNSRMCSE